MMVNIICKNLNSPMVIRSPKPANDPFLFGNGEVRSRPLATPDEIFMCDDGKVKA